MTDYTKATGSSGTMMIRDTGSVVEFWLKAGSSTFTNNLPWGYTANGTSPSATFDFASGGNWQRISAVQVNTDQNVTFRIGDSGTSGLGGPTSFTVFIDRSSAPSPPDPPKLTVLSDDTIRLTWGGDGSNNGLAIDDRQWWGSSTPSPTTMHEYGGVLHDWTGLRPGTVYHFWARTHNAKGWSGYSARASATTFRVPDAPDVVLLSAATDTTVFATFTANGNGGAPITGYEIGYGTNSTAPTSIVPSDGSTTVVGLTPGSLHYFWARARNAVGWSPWGPRGAIKTLNVPDPPTTPVISGVTQTSVHVNFTANDNGGSPHTGYQVGYSTSSSGPQTYVDSDGGTTLINLDPGTTYYFWARSQNVYGWSQLSGVSVQRTLAGAWVMVGNVWKEAVPYINVDGEWKLAQTWAKIAGVWKETG